MFIRELHEDYARYVEEWKKAEVATKLAEQTEQKLNITSILELRYAGRRFIEIIEHCTNNEPHERDKAKIQKILFEATQNCIRARNDAIDVVMTFITTYFLDVEDRYTSAVVMKYFPQYVEIRNLVFDINTVVSGSRKNAMDERNEAYDRIQNEYLPRASQLYRQMVTSEDLIDKDIRQAQINKEKEEEKIRKANIVNWSISVVSAVIALASLAVAVIALI